MPAELDRNEQTGQAAVFTVGDSAWHLEGTAPNLDEAMRISGTRFTVGLEPIYVADGSGGYFKSPTGQVVRRLDRPGADGVLATVGDGYDPLQNPDAFGVLEPLLDRGVAKLETGGSLRGGRDVWMLVRWDIDNPVIREVFADETVPFGLITNNHASKRRAVVMDTPIRVVCANTLKASLDGMSEDNSISVVHRGGARVRMIEAAEKLWGGIIERYVAIAEQYRTMKETILTVEQFAASVLETLAPMPEGPCPQEPAAKAGFERATQNAAMRRSVLTQKWYEGRGHIGDESAWEAFNGAVEVLDHDDSLFKVRGSRVESLINGKLAQRKREVLEAVLAIARR